MWPDDSLEEETDTPGQQRHVPGIARCWSGSRCSGMPANVGRARRKPQNNTRQCSVGAQEVTSPTGTSRSAGCGHATASLLVGKLSASGRQNALAAALKEYGALRRTIYAAKYLSDPDYRRRIARQLNKGESLHALRRDLLYAHEGMIRARHLEARAEQAWCLTLPRML